MPQVHAAAEWPSGPSRRASGPPPLTTARDDLTTITDPGSVATTFSYDDERNQSEMVETIGTTTSKTYAYAASNPITYEDPTSIDDPDKDHQPQPVRLPPPGTLEDRHHCRQGREYCNDVSHLKRGHEGPD
jgi:YD repeat-containing protein